MRRPAKLLVLGHVVMAAALVAALPSSGRAESKSRGVTILDEPTPGPSTRPQAPAAPAEAPTPAPLPGAGLPPGARLNAPASQPGSAFPAQPGSGRPIIPTKAANAAGLSLEISPDVDIPIGTKVSFRVSTKKEGYLVLVDVDPSGKLTQIYPNPMSLMTAGAGRQNSNLVKPGKPVLIPNPSDGSGFEFVASPPQGTAMVVALLSEQPVQVIDLPDIPANLLGQADAVGHLTTLANELRVPSGDSGQLQQIKWSLDAKFYSIR